MKNFFCILVFAVLFTIPAYSQNTNLEMNIQKIQNTDNWELILNYTFASPVDSGIFVELPVNLAATPVSISLDGQEMWLKNSKENINNDSVVYWASSDSGIVLRFNSGLIQANSRISVRFITQVSSNADFIDISIKRMFNRNEVSNEIMASDSLNITQ